ncbi:MAG TPA: 2-polyprenyl-3-methyl-6-methoxy-1,4-benzoquinone monooxygenase [Burkholderiaceae bacterium]|nr:2-polyprenyl-3-methyl-6-methoxy-1,4-benzoquinone monooxygenase [Burkholderiaceae bacterium]
MMKPSRLSALDQLIAAADRALRTLASEPPATRSSPASALPTSSAPLSEEERREAAALMRVNHVGEVCAQAMYDAQALATKEPDLREKFVRAAQEEADHLAWTRQRIDELEGRTSLLNPLWYAGAFAIGTLAARMGDRVSLGFLAETERQVEQHLQSHLERLPAADAQSRAIVEQMKHEEAQHAESAVQRGASTLPYPARLAMRLAARLMTKTAHYL